MSEQEDKPALYAGTEHRETAETALFQRVERAKQEWESALDALPELICVVDYAGQVVRANRTVERWRLGSVKRVTGQSLHKLLHRECGDACPLGATLTTVRQKAQAGEPGEHELFDRYLGRYLRVRARPVDRLRMDQTQNVVIILHDITEKKQMEHALKRHARRLEGINAISHAILVSRSPEEIGRAALERMAATLGFRFGQVFIAGIEPRQVMVLAAFGDGERRFQPGLVLPLAAFGPVACGRPYSTAILPDLAEVGQRSPVEEYWLRRGMCSSLRLPLTMEHTQIGFLYLVAEQPGAFSSGAVELVREAAELLTIAIHQSQLYQRLHQSHKEMENLLRSKHEMVQNVSHEVRAPLALLQGYAEILQDGTLGPLTEKQAEAVDILSRKGRQLLDVVDRLLTLQTIDKTRLDKTPIDVAAMLRQLAREWEFHVRRSGMSVEVDVPWHLDPVHADRALLTQVVSNLVDNAVKYSPNGGTIRVTAYEGNGEIVIGVRDEGQGIAPEALADVFERFFREGNSRSSVKGVGIGLALCRAVVEAHDGRIWAESEGRGKGTAFSVALPR